MRLRRRGRQLPLALQVGIVDLADACGEDVPKTASDPGVSILSGKAARLRAKDDVRVWGKNGEDRCGGATVAAPLLPLLVRITAV